jgi:hypothetical protein
MREGAVGIFEKKGPQKWQQHRCDAAAKTKLKEHRFSERPCSGAGGLASDSWHCADVVATKSAVRGKKYLELNAR